MPTQAELETYANAQASAYGIPADYFTRFIQAESGWNPGAVSSKGAEGIVQIVPNMHPEAGDPFDSMHAISWAAGYLRQLYDKYGSWDLAFAAYNAGEGAVAKYGGVPPYQETQSYVSQITGGGSSGSPGASSAPSVSLPGSSPVSLGTGPGASTFTKVLIWTAAIVLGLVAFHNLVSK
jgi:hypothetical protein